MAVLVWPNRMFVSVSVFPYYPRCLNVLIRLMLTSILFFGNIFLVLSEGMSFVTKSSSSWAITIAKSKSFLTGISIHSQFCLHFVRVSSVNILNRRVGVEHQGSRLLLAWMLAITVLLLYQYLTASINFVSSHNFIFEAKSSRFRSFIYCCKTGHSH